MKKLLAIAAMIITVTTTSYADDIVLTTQGTIVGDVAEDNSVLVNIQGEIYAVEDTDIDVLHHIQDEDKVIIGIHLNEDDRISKLYIVGEVN